MMGSRIPAVGKLPRVKAEEQVSFSAKPSPSCLGLSPFPSGLKALEGRGGQQLLIRQE